MTIEQRYEAYRAECEKTDAGCRGAVLREATLREQELYADWQVAIRGCSTWSDSEGTIWRILSKYQVGNLEMWVCRIEKQGKPAEIANCYAWAIRESAEPVEDEESQVQV